MILKESDKARFWNKVIVGNEQECWIWTASKNRGYGQLSKGVGKSPYKAHQFSWLLHHGEIPKGLEVCHTCDTPSCVNPYHLFLDTHRGNLEDAVRKGRIHNYTHGFGEDSNTAIFSNNDVAEIRRLYATGKYRAVDLATEWNVCEATIRDIIRNKTYVDQNFVPINGNAKERPTRRKFDELKIKQILQLASNGLSMTEIANVVNSNRNTVALVVNGKY